ncbi:DUF1822 family protein [Aetokthonos hydrillicola Thurmond2011]|jgi:hypothetical protein|uniref:DUF1822 family protein n=1 Tax=Aetokthonos hydrillicola Thurmond2011 TaxID=2712845 RepID=A0AAP5I7Z7_9CYAN|nr:DUF1822 family protein [Aetokthonos hydrillicola]MBO3462212.1 DUF1822 family protein [Aetokthonos hydrillicola CCALA 1050]MBW4585090.1 DUF1822 family protein [Aetokthonos hydrillicola CCALA 1050]MDR9894150.1 DUF1822 family protein [Aetokthonos hydrillicola Thurmond2011]
MSYLNELETTFLNQLQLNISSVEQNLAWEQAQEYSNTLARYNTYLNRVCLYTFLDWLTDWLAEEPVSKPSIYPTEDSLPSFWEVISGTAIQVGEKRIVLIPSETMDLEELCVPQEWIDIPTLAGDYYLAVQVNLGVHDDEYWMKVCGFTTHRQIKQQGKYNKCDRTYIMPVENLTKNLTVMLVMMELYTKEEIPKLPSLSKTEAQQLLQILGDPSLYFPRLQADVTFEQWAALLENNEWRIQLYHRRIGRFIAAKNSSVTNNLSNWFQNIFESGWESINALTNTESLNLALAFRQREVALKEKSVEAIKLIDLGMQLGSQSVAMLIGLAWEDEQKVGIRVQLHPASGETYLPPNIKLALVSRAGKTLQEFTSRSQDNFIQLKRFTCPIGKSFKIQVAINDFSIIEEFVV